MKNPIRNRSAQHLFLAPIFPLHSDIGLHRAAEPADSHYNESLRWALVHHAIYAIIDLIVAPFFLVAIAIPWRTAAVIQAR